MNYCGEKSSDSVNGRQRFVSQKKSPTIHWRTLTEFIMYILILTIKECEIPIKF